MIERDDDPLKGADVGETVAVSEVKEIHAIDLEPDAFRGTDRFADYKVTVTERDDGTVEIHYDGEVTKRMPRQWDSDYWQHSTGTDGGRLPTWLGTAVGAATAFSVAVVVYTEVAAQLAGRTEPVELTGPPFDPVSWLSLVPIVLLIVVISWGINGGFPGMIGGRR